MTFQQTSQISLLNAPLSPFAADQSFNNGVGNAALDDLFLNFPFDFTFDEDPLAPSQPMADSRSADAFLTQDLTAMFSEKQPELDMSAQYTLATLPRSATMGPNKLAATPSTALAMLQRKQQYVADAVSGKRGAEEFEITEDGEFEFDPPVLSPEPPTKRQRLATDEVSSRESSASLASAATSSVLAAPSRPETPGPSGSASADKRIRNNQASARFRAKKKLREMQVENTARDAIIRAEILERRVKEMEMEVAWLRGIVGGQGDAAREGGDGTARKTLRQVYEENGVAWREGALSVAGNGPAVSGGPLPPPAWGVTEEGEVFTLPVAPGGPAAGAASAQLADIHKAQSAAAAPLLAALPTVAALPVQLAIPPAAKRGRPPKKVVNIANVAQPVASLGKVVPGGVIVGGLAGLLPLLVQSVAAAPAKKK